MTEPLPFWRCPSCGAIHWPPRHPVTHRPRCPHHDTDPSTWNGDTHE
jgi:hypothetical protein